MGFWSSLRNLLFHGDVDGDRYTTPYSVLVERQQPPPPPSPPRERIPWPWVEAKQLASAPVLPAESIEGVHQDLADEIREELQKIRQREEEEIARLRAQQQNAPQTDSGMRWQKPGGADFPGDSGYPYDPLFDDFARECTPRAFTDRVRRGVREVYGGDAVPFYRAAGISRSAYSRLISYPERHASKDTALAMAAALKLDEEGAKEFLELAGYAFSPSYPSDAVWRICFRRGIHDLPTIRALLKRV